MFQAYLYMYLGYFRQLCMLHNFVGLDIFFNYTLIHREKESNDHALMLRELQKLVTDERSAKEKLEIELQSVKDSLKALQLAGTYNAEYEKRVRDLESELKSKNRLIGELKVKAREKIRNSWPPELLKLKDDLNEMKLSHRRELERAEQKTLTTEERSTSLSGQQETRAHG